MRRSTALKLGGRSFFAFLALCAMAALVGFLQAGRPSEAYFDTGTADLTACNGVECDSASMGSFTVDSTGDESDSNPGDGVCDNGAGLCTLRAAIEEANALVHADQIAFDIPGAGPHTIQPASPLPPITEAISIDGSTEPNFGPGPAVEIDNSLHDGDGLRLAIGSDSSTIRGLAINRAGGDGIAILSRQNRIEGNYIGTDVSGTVDLGNGGSGVSVTNGQNNRIGGADAGQGNVISGNELSGISIEGVLATHNRVRGNLIGTDAGGGAGLGNGSNGVSITDAPDNTIGGAAVGEGNVISDNGASGILIEGTLAVDNRVRGNLIGTDADGTAALGNGSAGVAIVDASGNRIGGVTLGEGNVISANGASGIRIEGTSTFDTWVRGNLIGTDVTGAPGLGNSSDGITIIAASGTLVGGGVVGYGNVIASNGASGVCVVGIAAVGNTIRGNVTHSNGALGIDLESNLAQCDGLVDTNDLGDPDTGANGHQNYPVLTAASTGSTIIDGTLNSTPDSLFTLDFYRSASCDGSGHGEGAIPLGARTVTTDGIGDVTFSVVLAATSQPGEFITATATATDVGVDSNSSEFSTCITVGGAEVGDVVGVPDNPGFNGDGPGDTTLVDNPTGVYETGSVNSLYFADSGNNIVRKYKGDGTVVTLAGIDPDQPQTPCAGSIGDGCPARQALLSGPRDVFVHSNGDIFIADQNNCRIRKVVGGADGIVNGDNDGEIISTIAGTGACAFGGDGGQATSAQLNHPAGVAVDAAGNVYIADTDNNRIRRVDAGSGVITTIAGDGNTGTGNFGDGGPATSAQLNLPHDVFFLRPAEEDLLIADTLHHRIRRLDIDSGTISNLAGTTQGFSGDGGAALEAQLNGPEAIASAENRVFIADTKNNRIRRVTVLTGIIETVVGDGGLTEPITLDDPQGVAIGGGQIGIANTGNHTVVTATIDPDAGDLTDDLSPTQSCGIVPGVSSIDWVLPIGLLGLVIVRKRITTLFTQLGLVLRPLRGMSGRNPLSRRA